MSNVIPFPVRPRTSSAAQSDWLHAAAQPYEFNKTELATLGRWYAAMKYAFADAEARLCVNHESRHAWLHLFNQADGITPKCIIFKHPLGRRMVFSWVLDAGERRGPYTRLEEITDPHLRAIDLPIDSGWLDPLGWEAVLARRTVHGTLPG
jgi:hypothetical protein